MTWLTAVIALAAVALVGGWPWALVSLMVLAVVWRTDFRAASVLATVVPGLCWLALYQWTGDHRLFFPYAIQYAVQMAYLSGGSAVRRTLLGGGSVVLVFVLIRIAQSATAGVLLVEVLVAAAVLALASGVHDSSGRDLRARVLSAAVSSVLAYAGLAF